MLSGILSSAISGLSVNAQRVASSADDLANVSTAAYKQADVHSTTVATRQTSTAYAAGGVQASVRASADVQGLLAPSTRSTDLAISGAGYFPVARSASGGETFYTRDGSFQPDAQGNLVNASGYVLLGRAPGGGGLQPVNVNAVSGTAQATSRVAVGANLPAGANAGEVYRVDVQVTDSLGNAQNVTLEFEAQASGGYRLTIPGATQNDASGAAYDINVSFGGDGFIDSATQPDVYIPVSGGASPLSIQLDLSGLTQFSGDFTLGQVQSDGARYGSATGVSVAEDGTVSATFDNGERRAIATVEVATFANPQGLDAVGGNTYAATDSSGAPLLSTAGQGGAGTVQSGALELSNTDVGSELVNLILAQSAYAASLQVVRAGDELSRTLLNVRA